MASTITPETLDTVDELLALRGRLSSVLSAAFVSLAHAKYVLGPAVAGPASFDNRMKALALLQTKMQHDGSVSEFEVVPPAAEPTAAESASAAADSADSAEAGGGETTTTRTVPESSSSTSQSTSTDPDFLSTTMASMTLRKRTRTRKNIRQKPDVDDIDDDDDQHQHDHASSEDKEDNRDDVDAAKGNDRDDKDASTAAQVDEEGKKPTKARPPNRDPLKWFGVLVPQSLRDSQQSFKQGLSLMMEVASLQVKLSQLDQQQQQEEEETL